MTRYIAIFAALLVFCLTLMAALLSQYGLSLLDPQMQPMLLVCLLVAAYVSWRITRILQKRAEASRNGAAGERPSGGLFGSLTNGKSKALQAREARLNARRRQLIAEGKLAPEEVAEAPAPLVRESTGAPTRAAASASVKEKMAARAERVRRAREEGKI